MVAEQKLAGARLSGASARTDPPAVLSPRMVHVIEGLAADCRRLDERIEGLSGEIEELAKRDAGCERLMSIPGIGPIMDGARQRTGCTRPRLPRAIRMSWWNPMRSSSATARFGAPRE